MSLVRMFHNQQLSIIRNILKGCQKLIEFDYRGAAVKPCPLSGEYYLPVGGPDVSYECILMRDAAGCSATSVHIVSLPH
jgi:hypothetical protein